MRLFFAALISAPVLLAAQSPAPRPPAHPDYAKADLIRTSGAFVLNATVNPVWLQDSTRFCYRSASPKGETVVYLIPGQEEDSDDPDPCQGSVSCSIRSNPRDLS